MEAQYQKLFSEVPKAEEQWTVPLNALLYNIAEGEYLINTTSASLKTAMLLP